MSKDLYREALAVCALQVSIAVERVFVIAYAKKVGPGIMGVMTLTYPNIYEWNTS